MTAQGVSNCLLMADPGTIPSTPDGSLKPARSDPLAQSQESFFSTAGCGPRGKQWWSWRDNKRRIGCLAHSTGLIPNTKDSPPNSSRSDP